ncbi:MAG: hypothetical protein AAGA58_03140 [Verrucomicrobiota bacterium]
MATTADCTDTPDISGFHGGHAAFFRNSPGNSEFEAVNAWLGWGKIVNVLKSSIYEKVWNRWHCFRHKVLIIIVLQVNFRVGEDGFAVSNDQIHGRFAPRPSLPEISTFGGDRSRIFA